MRDRIGVHTVRAGIPLNMVQKWLGHAQLSITAIYADAVCSGSTYRSAISGRYVTA